MILAKNNRNGKTLDPAIACLLCNRLLERWAELEPSSHKADSAKRWRLVKAPAMRSMIIQSLVQDEIAAKSLFLVLEYSAEDSQWNALVSRAERDGDDCKLDELGSPVWHEEPAIALLSAYVQALEVLQTKGFDS